MEESLQELLKAQTSSEEIVRAAVLHSDFKFCNKRILGFKAIDYVYDYLPEGTSKEGIRFLQFYLFLRSDNILENSLTQTDFFMFLRINKLIPPQSPSWNQWDQCIFTEIHNLFVNYQMTTDWLVLIIELCSGLVEKIGNIVGYWDLLLSGLKFYAGLD
jgi:hypothetical protein